MDEEEQGWSEKETVTPAADKLKDVAQTSPTDSTLKPNKVNSLSLKDAKEPTNLELGGTGYEEQAQPTHLITVSAVEAVRDHS